MMTVSMSLSNEAMFVLFVCSELFVFLTVVSGEANFPGKVDEVEDKFHINSNTIIRTQDSRAMGARYLNETELATNRACLIWCWETAGCNVAVFEEKSKGSCYLFDCGSPSSFRCKFTVHDFYTSSILKITHSYDLSDWGNQVKHENELAKLQGNAGGINGPPPSETSAGAAVAKQVIFSTPPPNVSVNHRNDHRCRHYQFQCINGSECIAIYNVCDGIPQCPDGSDESTDLQCPNRDDNHKSSSPSPVALVPTQSSLNQGINAPPSAFENRVQTSALGSQDPQKSLMVHTSSNRLEPQQPLQNNPVSAVGSVGSGTKLLDRNTVWREGDDSMQDSPPPALKHGPKVPVGPGSPQSPFIHKHSKFVAANDPHVQYSNRWTDDYDQYLHQPPHQEQYNPYDKNYLNDRYLNNRMTSEFDQGVYDSYHPEQNAYWTGQDPIRGSNYDGSDFAQSEYHGSPRQSSYSEQSDGYPSNQPATKYANADMYNRPNQPHGSARGPSMDQSSRPSNLQLPRQKTQNVPSYYVPYGDQSQLNYPSYAEPKPIQSGYIPQKTPGGSSKDEPLDGDYMPSNNRPLDRDYISKQHAKFKEKLMQSQEPTANVLSNTVLPDTPSGGKETVTPDEEQVTDNTDKLHEDPTTVASTKPSKAPKKTYYTHVGNLLEGQKMTVAELYASSSTHVHESNSAILALALGLCVTALLLVLVGCRMRAIRRRIARKGRSLAHDADYLVNGMYL